LFLFCFHIYYILAFILQSNVTAFPKDPAGFRKGAGQAKSRSCQRHVKKGVNLRIGFISTRFSGTDSISLEASRWSDLFEAAGHDCFWLAGQLAGQVDRHPDASMVTSLAHYNHPEIKSINTRVFGKTGRDLETTEKIHRLRALLKTKLYLFITRYRLDLLVVANALTIPMNIPLGLAITETVAETGIPTIAHHHDFARERDRYARNGVSDYLQMAFPPKLPNIEHVVINSAVREELARRHGISSTVIPNVRELGQRNYPFASRYFSDEVLRDKIEVVFKSLLGGSIQLGAETDRPDNVVDFRPSFTHHKAAVL
jgi:hypothetical protein